MAEVDCIISRTDIGAVVDLHISRTGPGTLVGCVVSVGRYWDSNGSIQYR